MCRFGKSPRTLFKPRFCNSFSGYPEGAESVDASCCVRTFPKKLTRPLPTKDGGTLRTVADAKPICSGCRSSESYRHAGSA
jgi:hypothetical protein